jgi:hypothetical protein
MRRQHLVSQGGRGRWRKAANPGGRHARDAGSPLPIAAAMKPGTSPRSSPIWPRFDPGDLLFGHAPAGGKPWTRSIALGVLTLARIGMAGSSHAQDYPVRRITLEVPFAARSGTTSSPG